MRLWGAVAGAAGTARVVAMLDIVPETSRNPGGGAPVPGRISGLTGLGGCACARPGATVPEMTDSGTARVGAPRERADLTRRSEPGLELPGELPHAAVGRPWRLGDQEPGGLSAGVADGVIRGVLMEPSGISLFSVLGCPGRVAGPVCRLLLQLSGGIMLASPLAAG